MGLLLSVLPDSNGIFSLSIIMLILTGLAVLLRLVAVKAITKLPFAAEDWWLLFSLISFYAYMGIQLWCRYIPSVLDASIK